MKSTGTKKVYYHTRRQGDLPADERWLTRQEAGVLTGLKFAKRRRDWLLGRWTAKSALARFAPAPDRTMTDWQIKADADGAPAVLLDGRRVGISISLSHSGNHSICVLAEKPLHIGCDLEQVEVRSRSFEETFFTSSELALLDRVPASDRPCLVTLIWSAKESALKALRTGLKADTRRVRMTKCPTLNSSSWHNFEIEDTHEFDEIEDTRGGCTFYGWWREHEGMVITVVSDRSIDPPTAL
jgi:4'-phosphopantetheinyl transferase